MFRTATIALATLGIAAAAISPATAQRYDGYQGDHRTEYREARDYRQADDYQRDYQQNGYRQSYSDYGYPQQRGYRSYNGYDRRYHARRCRDGDGGTIIGAIAGGLLGSSVAGRGDHLLGGVLGAGAGALAGRAIDRSDRPNYCR